MSSFFESFEGRRLLSAAPVDPPISATQDGHGVVHIELNNGNATVRATGSTVSIGGVAVFNNVTRIVVDAEKGTTNQFDFFSTDSTLAGNTFDGEKLSDNTITLTTLSGNDSWIIDAGKDTNNTVTDQNDGSGTDVVVLDADKGSNNVVGAINTSTGTEIVVVDAGKGSTNVIAGVNLSTGTEVVVLDASKGSTNEVDATNADGGTETVVVDAAKGANDTIVPLGTVTIVNV